VQKRNRGEEANPYQRNGTGNPVNSGRTKRGGRTQEQPRPSKGAKGGKSVKKKEKIREEGIVPRKSEEKARLQNEIS